MPAPERDQLPQPGSSRDVAATALHATSTRPTRPDFIATLPPIDTPGDDGAAAATAARPTGDHRRHRGAVDHRPPSTPATSTATTPATSSSRPAAADAGHADAGGAPVSRRRPATPARRRRRRRPRRPTSTAPPRPPPAASRRPWPRSTAGSAGSSSPSWRCSAWQSPRAADLGVLQRRFAAAGGGQPADHARRDPRAARGRSPTATACSWRSPSRPTRSSPTRS